MIEIHNGVKLPFKYEEYISPDFEAWLEYYPQYCDECLEKDLKPWNIQAYICFITKNIAKNVERFKDDTHVLGRYLQHVGGYTNFRKLIEKGMEYHTNLRIESFSK